MQKTLVYGLIVIIIAVLTAASYAALNHGNSNPNFNYPYSQTNVSGVVNGINNSNFKVYSSLSNQSGNIFFSPFSISTALAMVEEGAVGNTSIQMLNVLNLSHNASANRQGFAGLLSSLNGGGAGYQISVADSVWTENSFAVKQTFSNTLSTYYDAVSQQVDFANNTEGARASINNWVSGRTNNKIVNLIPQGGLTAYTKLVLVNAIYFKGMWAEQLNPKVSVAVRQMLV